MGILEKITKRTPKKTESEKTEKNVVKTEVKVKTAAKAPAKKEVVKKDEKAVAPVKNVQGQKGAAYKVLLHPLISEKAAIAESTNVYTFVVAGNANKQSIKKAVKEVYGVDSLKVRIINTSGKTVRSGRSLGYRGGQKKALIVLPKGKSISVHAGV